MPDLPSHPSDSTPQTPEQDGDPMGTTDDRPGKEPVQLRCPHCHNPIRLPDTRDDEVLCPGCGGSFRVRDARLTDTVSTSRPLGKFRLMERVGQGAFGAVWKARDSVLDRVVALKIPHTGLLTEDEDLERFHREARAAAQLRHPGIVTVHEVQTLEGLPVIVSDFVQGVTLKDLLEVRRLAFGEAVELVASVAEALEYAHTMGLVHRDIKPANIMLERGATTAGLGRPMLMDFGLALRDEAEVTLTLEGHVIGTPAYMSPEQAAGKSHQADRRSDVYSLGVILYELLAGELPFRGSKQMILYQVLHEEPRSPRKLNDKVPRDLETVCLKCLSKEPAKRYETAGQLAADLRRWLAGEPVQARPVGAVERWVRWARRRPALAAVYGLLAAVLVLGSAGGTAAWLWQRAELARREAVEVRDQLAQKTEQTETALKEVQRAREGEAAALGREQVERERAEQTLYLRQIGLAQREWQNAQVGKALDLLDACPAERRGWEWDYLRRLCRGTPVTMLGHTSAVSSVAFSPDGKRIASGSHDRTVKVWDVQTGQETLNLKGYTRPIDSVAFSPDGKRIASGDSGGTVKVWDAQTGQETLSLKGHTSRISSVAFSPDGKRIASGSKEDQTVKVWDALTGQQSLNLKGHTRPIDSVAFSPDGKRIASGGPDGTVQVWDAQSGQRSLNLKRHTGSVSSVAFSPDGKRIASGDSDGTVKVWDSLTGQQSLNLKGHTYPVHSVAFSPDGKRIASGSGELEKPGKVKVWDAQNGQEILSLKGHTSKISSVAFSPDGKRIASASWDQTVKVWDALTGQEAPTFNGRLATLSSVAVSLDGKCIASGDAGGTVKVWDAQTGQETLSFKGHTRGVHSVAFSPDGKRIASASGMQGKPGEAKVWDAQTGQETLNLKGHTYSVHGVTFSPDGNRIASASGEQTVKVWDALTGQEILSLKGHTNAVHSVAFSPDGKRIASGSGKFNQHGEVIVWDAQTGQETLSLKGHTGQVWSVAFSPDGNRIASGSQDQTVKVWDAQTGQEILSLKGHTNAVHSVAFSPDGKRIASASMDNTVKMWDAQTGQETLSLEEDTKSVGRVIFSPDGKRILGTVDQRVKVWDAQSGLEHLTLKGHTDRISSVAFSPDGKHLASASWDQTVKVWDTLTGQQSVNLKGHTRPINSVAFSPDGKRIASGSGKQGEPGEVKVWDAQTGQETLNLKGHTNVVHIVAFSPDGKRIASASWDQTVKVWDALTGQERLTLKATLSSMAFSPDGKRIASGDFGGTVKVWDAQTGQETLSLKGHTRPVYSVAFSPDGKRISAQDAGGVWKTWDVVFGRELDSFPIPAADNSLVAVSPDRRFRAIAADNRIYLVDTQLTDEQRAELQVFWRDDPRWHEDQLRQAETERNEFAVDFHLSRLVVLKPDDPGLIARRGELHAQSGRWQEAVTAFTGLIARDPDKGNLFALARAQLGASQDEAYRVTVRRLAERTNRRAVLGAVGVAFGRTPADGLGVALTARLLARPLPPPNNDIVVARLGVACPDVLPAAELLAWAERAGLSSRGPALVRSKRFDEAAQAMAGWEKWPANPDASYRLLFVALAEHGRGNNGKARQAFSRATAWFDAPSKEDPKQTNFARLNWDLRIETDVLRREVEQLLGERREPGKMDRVGPADAP